MKMVKNTNFLKKNKNYQESLCKYKVAVLSCELAPLTRDVTCSKLQRYGENIGDKKLSVKQTPPKN